VLLLVLERRALVQGAADPPADHHDDHAEQERDSPSPRQQRVVGEGRDGDEDRRREDVAELGARQGEAGEVRALGGGRVFEGRRARAGLFAGHGQALQHAQDQQQDRRGDADLVVGGQHADEERGAAHAEQGDDQNPLAPDGVPEVAEDERADRAGNIGDAESGQRRNRRRRGIPGREEDLREDQGSGRPVNEEVVILQRAADPRRDRRLAWGLRPMRLVHTFGFDHVVGHGVSLDSDTTRRTLSRVTRTGLPPTSAFR
jgi:hypothetical protein